MICQQEMFFFFFLTSSSLHPGQDSRSVNLVCAEGAETPHFMPTQQAERERDREEGVGWGYKTLKLDLGNAFSSKVLSPRGSMDSQIAVPIGIKGSNTRIYREQIPFKPSH